MPIVLRRFCSMLAHQQGATLNLSKLAGSLGIDGKTARRYLDLLEGQTIPLIMSFTWVFSVDIKHGIGFAIKNVNDPAPISLA